MPEGAGAGVGNLELFSENIFTIQRPQLHYKMLGGIIGQKKVFFAASEICSKPSRRQDAGLGTPHA